MVKKRPMVVFLTQLLLATLSRFTRRARLEAENLILRQQLVVLRCKSLTRVRLWNIDRLLLVCLYRLYPSLLDAIIIVQPETVIRWHRRGFRAYWRWKSCHIGGRPRIDSEIRALIRRMSRENPLWGAPRIHGELLMLGIEVAESTVGRYMIRRRRSPSQGWKTFLRNHAAGHRFAGSVRRTHVSFKLLYGLVILRHARGRPVAISVITNPTAEWTAGQVTDAFPWDEAPSHLIRDRDGAFGPSLHPSHSGNGDPRSSDCAALTVAERPRRAPHRLDPARISRSSGCVRRSALASRSEEVRFLLQPGPDASLIGQECAGFSAFQKLDRIAAISILGRLHHNISGFRF
jgi:hypothetical protein